MGLTYNQIIKLLREFTDAHFILKSFGNGEPWELVESSTVSDINYPMMWVQDQPNTVQQGEEIYNFRIYFLNQVATLKEKTDTTLNETNVNEVKSDMRQCATDLISYFAQDTNYPDLNIDRTVNLTSFTEDFNDTLTGWYIDLRFNQAFKFSSCNLPVDGIPTPPSITCEDATEIITDSNDNELYSNTIASGGTNTQRITDSNVSNSDDTYTVDLLAQQNLELPDITHTDSDLTPVTLPAQTPMICTPSGGGGVENLDLIKDIDFSTLANLDDFTSSVDGSTTMVLDGGFLKISGTPASLLPVDNLIYNNYVTGLESWCFSFEFQIKSHSSGNEGIAIGFRSDSSSAILRQDLFYLYRNSASGLDGQIYFSRNNATPTNFISNPITQNIDDEYRFTMTRTFQEFTIKIENLTLGEVESQTYSYDYSTSASPLTPRSSNLFIGHVGGTNWITNYKFKSNQKKNVDYLVVGDSITDGYSTDFWSQRWLDIVRNCQTQFTFTKSACQGDKVSTAVNKQDEYTLINANKAILFIGTNQIISDGAGSALASYDILYVNLQSLGITDFIHLNALPRGGSTQINTFNAGLLTRYGADVIDLNTYFNDGSDNIKASLDSGDGVHPNIEGQRYIAEKTIERL